MPSALPTDRASDPGRNRRLAVGAMLLSLLLSLLAAPPPVVAADTDDPASARQWHLDAIQVPLAWERSTGKGAVVAVLDSGISPGPDLACRSFVAEYDARSGTSGPVPDGSGHGTHIAGTIAQCSENGLRAAGVAPDATLMDVRVLDDSPSSGGQAQSGDVADGIIHAATNGADVINLSIAIPCTDAAPTYEQGCRFADIDAAIEVANAADVLVVAAAGNDGSGRVGYPANHPDVLAVGSLDAAMRTPSYATTGSALDVVAPGGASIDADRNGEADGVFQEWFDPSRGTHRLRGLFGSSHAAAHVSGVAALLRSADPSASATAIADVLRSTACDLGVDGTDARFGAGIVRAADALAALLDDLGRGVCYFDVEPDSVFFGFVSIFGEMGITRGCTANGNRFCPTDPVTREQMAAFLDRALDLPEASRDWFRDDEQSMFEASIDRLREAGITRGCNPPANDRFCPTDRVTRGQMAAFIDRAIDLPTATRDWFRDDEDSIFEASINRLREGGITQGCNPPTNDRYCPRVDVARQEMAVFIVRALDR